MTSPLFETTHSGESWLERLGPDTVLLHGFALAAAPALMDELAPIAAYPPPRYASNANYELTVGVLHPSTVV